MQLHLRLAPSEAKCNSNRAGEGNIRLLTRLLDAAQLSSALDMFACLMLYFHVNALLVSKSSSWRTSPCMHVTAALV